ncbi:PIN domain-containing protein [Candidatus Woesearchaeota archaeon]|nr:PIN domain-containing protein [Candidatus Woesearchaeota archaeon]
MTEYYYDSYAVIEYINDNPAFASFFEEHTGILSIFHLVEIYYSVLREDSRDKAAEVLNALWPLTVQVAKETVEKAMAFKLAHRKDELSYADCIGYALAQERNILFLTGDKAFRSVKGTQFVPR